MESANTRYVRRSASLLDYGSHFKYSEAWTHSSFLKAALYASAFIVAMVTIWWYPVRWALSRMLPPGSGPSEKSRKNGFMKVEVYGTSEVIILPGLITCKGWIRKDQSHTQNEGRPWLRRHRQNGD